MEILFLGTSGMVPTKDRNHSSFLINHPSEKILVDCGEGVQRQLKTVGFSLMKITRILISHWHGDHTLGLPGLMQTMAAGSYEGTLKIYGPKGTKKRIDKMHEAFIFDNSLDLEVYEYAGEIVFKTMELTVKSYKLDHTIESFGFRFEEKDKRKIKQSAIKKYGVPDGPLLGDLQRGKDIEFKGKKISAKDVTYIVPGRVVGVIVDTALCDNCAVIAKNVDILISESTYESKLEDKAEEYKHMTARQAALIASQNNAKKLVLYHYSQRYKTTEKILEDAKDVFDNVIAADDFTKIKL